MRRVLYVRSRKSPRIPYEVSHIYSRGIKEVDKKLKEITRNIWLPSLNSSSSPDKVDGCPVLYVDMILGNIYDFSNVPCNEVLSDIFLICSKEDVPDLEPDIYNSVAFENNTIKKETLQCPERWFVEYYPEHYRCTLIAPVTSPYSAIKEKKCSDLGGRIVQKEDLVYLHDLKMLSRFMETEQFKIPYTRKTRFAGCHELGMDGDCLWFLTSHPNYVICVKDIEESIIEISVSSRHFHCGDGTAILYQNVCNKVSDCYDQSDEKDCKPICVSLNGIYGISDCSSCKVPECKCAAHYFQ